MGSIHTVTGNDVVVHAFVVHLIGQTPTVKVSANVQCATRLRIRCYDMADHYGYHDGNKEKMFCCCICFHLTFLLDQMAFIETQKPPPARRADGGFLETSPGSITPSFHGI